MALFAVIQGENEWEDLLVVGSKRIEDFVGDFEAEFVVEFS